MAKMRMTAAGRRGDRGGGGMQHNGCHRQAFGAKSGQHPNMHSGQGWCGGALEWPAYQPFTRKCVQQATGQFTHSPTAQPSRTAQPHSPAAQPNRTAPRLPMLKPASVVQKMYLSMRLATKSA